MSFQQKNVVVTLANFSLILVFFLIRLAQLFANDQFTPENVFWLWGIVAVLTVAVTIIATILTHIGGGVLEAFRTRQEPRIDGLQDERDQLFDLRGTRITYRVTSIGSALAMLTYVLGQPPLMMFSLLIVCGLAGQIAGDIARLVFYRRGY